MPTESARKLFTRLDAQVALHRAEAHQTKFPLIHPTVRNPQAYTASLETALGSRDEALLRTLQSHRKNYKKVDMKA